MTELNSAIEGLKTALQREHAAYTQMQELNDRCTQANRAWRQAVDASVKAKAAVDSAILDEAGVPHLDDYGNVIPAKVPS